MHGYDGVMESVEALAAVLAVMRVKKRGLSRPDRVRMLLDSGDPGGVLAELTGPALLDDAERSEERV